MFRSAAAVALLAALLLATPAAAETVTRTDGTTVATFAFTPVQDGLFARDLRLTVARDGATVFDGEPAVEGCTGDDARCFASTDSLSVDDVDADGAPDVVLNLFTGGAHCCGVVKAFLAAGPAVERNFGNPGARLRDLDGDGVPELLSADDRFAYRYASYASSGFPVRVFRIRAGRLRDVTRSFPGRIRADARRYKALYKRALRARESEPHGPLAAWVADQHALGRGAQARRYLRRQLALGNLDEGLDVVQSDGRTFVRRLLRDMDRLGYRR